jgi:hypothetical protein
MGYSELCGRQVSAPAERLGYSLVSGEWSHSCMPYYGAPASCKFANSRPTAAFKYLSFNRSRQGALSLIVPSEQGIEYSKNVVQASHLRALPVKRSDKEDIDECNVRDTHRAQRSF